MMNEKRNSPVTIEDLLRLKRAEHPEPEFWSEFDRQLHEKQLAALVAKRPWWSGFPRAVRGFSRYHLPLAATAVLAISLVGLRNYRPAQQRRPQVPSLNRGLVREDLPAPSVTNSVEARHEARLANAAEASARVAAEPVDEPLKSDGIRPGELSRIVPMLSAQEASRTSEQLPSVRSIAANLVAARPILGASSAPGLISQEDVAAKPAAPREPLAQMRTPADVRRSQFAMAFASMVADSSLATTARVARRLSNEQLYDTIHRFGANGNSVSFRF